MYQLLIIQQSLFLVMVIGNPTTFFPGRVSQEIRTDCIAYNNEGQCTRCAQIIMKDTRECVTSCLTESVFLEFGDVSGWVCFPSDPDNSDLSSQQIVTIVGATVGGFLCIILLALFIFAWCKRSRNQRFKQDSHNKNDVPFCGPYDNSGFEDDNVYEDISDLDLVRRLASLRENETRLLQLLMNVKECETTKSTEEKSKILWSTYHGLNLVLATLEDKQDRVMKDPQRKLTCKLVVWAENLLKLLQNTNLENSNSNTACMHLTPEISKPFMDDLYLKSKQQQEQLETTEL